MKKYSLLAAIVIIAAVTNWYYQQNKSTKLPDLALENINALASGEDWNTACCPDPGDTCIAGDIIVHDMDEC